MKFRYQRRVTGGNKPIHYLDTQVIFTNEEKAIIKALRLERDRIFSVVPETVETWDNLYGGVRGRLFDAFIVVCRFAILPVSLILGTFVQFSLGFIVFVTMATLIIYDIRNARKIQSSTKPKEYTATDYINGQTITFAAHTGAHIRHTQQQCILGLQEFKRQLAIHMEEVEEET